MRTCAHRRRFLDDRGRAPSTRFVVVLTPPCRPSPRPMPCSTAGPNTTPAPTSTRPARGLRQPRPPPPQTSREPWRRWCAPQAPSAPARSLDASGRACSHASSLARTAVRPCVRACVRAAVSCCAAAGVRVRELPHVRRGQRGQLWPAPPLPRLLLVSYQDCPILCSSS